MFVLKTSGDVLFDRSALTAVKEPRLLMRWKKLMTATFEENFRSLVVKSQTGD